MNHRITATDWAITRKAFEQLVTAQFPSDAKPRDSAELDMLEEQKVAVLPIRGVITPEPSIESFLFGGTALSNATAALDMALEDPEVSSIVLDIDSPGGHVTGVSEFAQKIAAADKPVLAYVRGTAASAAYWIASAADKVFMSETAEVGSIGVIVSFLDTSKLLEAMGVEEVEIVSSQSPLKRIDPTTDDGRAAIQARVDKFADIFISTVAKNRGVAVDTVLSDFGQGDILLAADAVKARMADEVTTFDNLIQTLHNSVEVSNSNQNDGVILMEITRELLEAEHKDLLKEIQTEAANLERARIQALDEIALDGYQDVIAKFKYEQPISAEQAAVEVLKLEKKERETQLTQYQEDVQEPVSESIEPSSKEDKLKKMYAESKQLQKQFGEESRFIYAVQNGIYEVEL